MSLFGTNNAAQYWARQVQNSLGGTPITLSCWIKNPSSNGAHLAWWHDSSFTVSSSVCSSGGNIVAQTATASTARKRLFTGNPAAGSWHHLAWFYGPDSNFALVVDGVSTGSSQTSGSPDTTQNYLQVVVNGPVGSSPPLVTAQIAEPAIWRAALSLPELQRLYRGANPLSIRPGMLMDYWPLRGDLGSRGGSGIALTPVGGAAAVWGDHPNIQAPPRRRLFRRLAAIRQRRPFVWTPAC